MAVRSSSSSPSISLLARPLLSYSSRYTPLILPFLTLLFLLRYLSSPSPSLSSLSLSEAYDLDVPSSRRAGVGGEGGGVGPSPTGRRKTDSEGGKGLGLRAGLGEMDKLLVSLVEVKEEEVGKMAICASVRDEGRFITEWLLYNRAIGVDRFYLYDTGSTDDTLEVLQPWIEAGTVVLHKFRHDQGGSYQLNSLETCSRTYASQTEWLLDADVDEFYVVPSSLLSYSRARELSPGDMPDRPLLRMLEDNYLYRQADVVAVGRVTWKNEGVQRMGEGESVLERQKLRDVYHSIKYGKLEFTKSLVHTRSTSGWVIPGAHFARHDTLAPSSATVISADGQSIEPVSYRNANGEDRVEREGTMYKGRIPWRTFEPIVMYHYVERDLDNCLAKLARAKVARKGGWRDKAGEAGCRSYELYQPSSDPVPMHERDSLYGAALLDHSMSDSWYGRFLPPLIRSSLALAKHLNAKHGGARFQPLVVDPHPDIVRRWKRQGRDERNGELIVEKRAEQEGAKVDG
ncbi:hypothetical protein JCM10213_008952 [Rhodosporidiobolus nylandii]